MEEISMKKEVVDSNYFMDRGVTVKQYTDIVIEMENAVLVEKELFENMVERIEHLTEGLKAITGDVHEVLNKRIGIREIPKELELICEKGSSLLCDPTMKTLGALN